MKRVFQNLMVWVMALAILTGGYFGMELIEGIITPPLNHITTVKAEQPASMLYVDEQEDLTFYPWTVYQPEMCVSLPIYTLSTEGNYREVSQEFHRLFDRAGLYLHENYMPTADFSEGVYYQESNQKFYLPPTLFLGKNGLYYTFQAVWDGTRFEAVHILSTTTSSPLSNDERQARTAELETAIRQNREKHPSTEWEEVKTEIMAPTQTEVESDSPPISAEGELLDNFMALYTRINENGMDHQLIYDLLYKGDYHTVFYQGEILLFFMPHNYDNTQALTAEGTTGLLVFLDEQADRIRGFHLLNLES